MVSRVNSYVWTRKAQGPLSPLTVDLSELTSMLEDVQVPVHVQQVVEPNHDDAVQSPTAARKLSVAGFRPLLTCNRWASQASVSGHV